MASAATLPTRIRFRELEGRSTAYRLLLAAAAGMVVLGLGVAWYMAVHGHYVTGMGNQVVWGAPHVAAIFLILAASGVLNVASVASVFGRTPYKPLAPLSGLLALTLLVGGLVVLMLDLGRPDRLVIAMTTYNFRSIFAWNIFLYTGFLAVVAAYLWTMMARPVRRYSSRAGLLAFLWRIVLTTGTGSIFGFLVSRQAFDSALLAPKFVAMSLVFGMAIFILTLLAGFAGSGRPLSPALLGRLSRLLGVLLAVVLYFVAVYHLTHLYIARDAGLSRFILAEGSGYTAAFWGLQIVLGTLLPMALLFHPRIAQQRGAVAAACSLIVMGGLAQVYLIVIGSQVYPRDIFSGLETASTAFDGTVASYQPALTELVLGASGFALAALLTILAVRLFRFLPESLARPITPSGT